MQKQKESIERFDQIQYEQNVVVAEVRSDLKNLREHG